jgi:hypothetical protein
MKILGGEGAIGGRRFFRVKFRLLENEILEDAALVGQSNIYSNAPVGVRKIWWQVTRMMHDEEKRIYRIY